MGSAPEVPWASVWLRDLRVAAGYTQEQLAERAGLAVRSLGDLERGAVKRPHRDTVDLLCAALDLSEDAADRLRVAFRGAPSDAPLAATVAVGRGQVQRSPAELPRDILHFVGRAAELAEIGALLPVRRRTATSPVVIVVYGPGGFGKSTLAIHAAHDHSSEFSDGQIFVSLGGQGKNAVTAERAALEILWALGVPNGDIPRSPSARSRFLRTLTAPMRLLLVLDDAADAGQVGDLLPSGPGNAVIVTSRSPLHDLDTDHRIELSPFTRGDSIALLRRASTTTGDPAAWSKLAELCGDAPLALRISAARLASRSDWSAEDLVRRLEQEQTRLSFLEHGVLGMRSCLAVSVSALSMSGTAIDLLALSLLVRLARLPGRDLAIETIVAVAAAPSSEVEAAVERLIDVQLLQSRSRERVNFHDLTLLYARELPEEAAGAGDNARLGAYLAANIWDVAKFYGKEPEAIAELRWLESHARSRRHVFDWFRDEVPNLVEYVKQRSAANSEEYVLCRFIVQNVWVLLENARLADVRDEAVAALSEAAKRQHDPLTRIWCERQLGFAMGNQGDFDSANEHLAKAWELLPELPDDPDSVAKGRSWVQSLEGILAGMSGDLNAAISGLRSALRTVSGRNLQHRGQCLQNLAIALTMAGRPQEGLRYHLRQLAPVVDHPDDNSEILATLGVAECMSVMNKPLAAIRSAKRALSLAESARVPRSIFEALVMIAEQSYQVDLPEQAEAALDRARAVVATQSVAATWSMAAEEKQIEAARERYFARHT
ncbi:MAG: helix-turn-helix domain-containing protein [Nocardioidaceae bacterium]